MAHQPNPNDPYRPPLTDDIGREARLDHELQPDAELAEGPASGGRIAMFAVAVAVILGTVFYGLNNAPIHQAGTSATAQNTPQAAPAAPPGMRDVTPRSNAQPGMTTGAAPATPPTSTSPPSPPATARSGAANNGSTQ
jgi:hypothetical protein